MKNENIERKVKKKPNYYKLFQYLLYEQNNINKIRNKNYNIKRNNNFFSDEISNEEKPILIEHFINKENDNEDYNFIYLNNNIDNKYSFNSKKYYNLDFNAKDKNYLSRNSFSSKNSKINLSSLLSEICYKKNINQEVDKNFKKKSNDNFANFINENENNFLFFNKNINEFFIKTKNKKNFNFAFFPKVKTKISNYKKLLKNNEDSKNEKNNNSNQLSQKYINPIKINNQKKNKYKKKIRSISVCHQRERLHKDFNDMSQRNRFKKLKNDLKEETNKINNMMSEFFKGPLFNKFNKTDKIEDLKLKNMLQRPKSSLSL